MESGAAHSRYPLDSFICCVPFVFHLRISLGNGKENVIKLMACNFGSLASAGG